MGLEEDRSANLRTRGHDADWVGNGLT